MSVTRSCPRLAVLLAALLITLGQAQAQEVSLVAQADGSRLVKGSSYEMLIAANGMLDRLRVQGQDLADPISGSHAGYFYQDGVLPTPNLQQTGPTSLQATGEKASLTLEATAQKVTWTLTNLTDKKMVYVFALSTGVEAGSLDGGPLQKLPIDLPCGISKWYRGPAVLTITGSTRLWGPYAGKYTIWEVALLPKQARQVTFAPGATTAEERQMATTVATAVVKAPEDPEGPMWDMKALSQPPTTYPAEGFQAEGVRALYYDSVPFQGRPTRVFAWVGLPKVPAGQKVPGIVLIHGGGGTAFDTWVRLWTARGYAAIAMDTCGALPKGVYGQWERNPQGGPPGWGGFSQTNWPREDQWTYQAIAAVILGHSLLRSLPEVDPERIGATGISWGGYLCSLVAGVDYRLKFAVPVYGCGYYLDTLFGPNITALPKENAERWVRWWDPSMYLPQAAMPMLWVTGTNDHFYWFPALQKSYRATQGQRTECIRLRMPHGHGPAGEGPEEIRVFADSIVRGGAPLPHFTGQGRKGNAVWATFKTQVKITGAQLLHTRDKGKWEERKWEAVPAQVEAEGTIRATLPEGTTVYYFNLLDERNCVTSTEHVELAQ